MSTNRSAQPAARDNRDTARRGTESPIRVALIGFGHVGRALAPGPDAAASNMLTDLMTALSDHPAGGGAAAASRLR